MTTLSLSVQYAVSREALPSRYDFRRWVKAALTPDLPAAEMTIRVVDETEGLMLNETYRHKAYATNVLTFTFDDVPLFEGMPLLGDIVLCAPVVASEAMAQHKSLLAHYAHLVVHGVLHLQGYDHLHDEDAKVMEQLETDILQRLGFSDPYLLL